jgi:hypothetical protein
MFSEFIIGLSCLGGDFIFIVGPVKVLRYGFSMVLDSLADLSPVLFQNF